MSICEYCYLPIDFARGEVISMDGSLTFHTKCRKLWEDDLNSILYLDVPHQCEITNLDKHRRCILPAAYVGMVHICGKKGEGTLALFCQAHLKAWTETEYPLICPCKYTFETMIDRVWDFDDLANPRKKAA